MHTIQWFCERIKESNYPHLDPEYIDGVIYCFTCKGEKGSIIFKPYTFKKTEMIAYGYFGNTELIVKKEAGFFNNKQYIHDYKNGDARLGHAGYNCFFLRGKIYNTDYTCRNIFNKNNDNDMSVNIYQVFTQILLKLDINRVKKKWYLYVYDENLYGTICLSSEPDWEFILGAFIQLHYQLESMAHKS